MPDFAADPINPTLARKLDAFTVPSLPGDFADALLARAMVLPPASSPDPLPKLRRTARARWLRGGMAGFGLVAAGMMSVAAAASGWFGEPIRAAVEKAPLIGAVIEQVAPRPRPSEATLARRAAPITNAAQEVASPSPTPAVGDMPDRLERRAALRRRIEEKLADNPEARAWLNAHPRAAGRIIRRAVRRDPELREMVRQERERRRAERGLVPLPETDGPLTATDGPNGTESMPQGWRGERMRRWQERRERRLRRLEGNRQEDGTAPPPQEALPPEPPANAL